MPRGFSAVLFERGLPGTPAAWGPEELMEILQVL